MDIVKNIRVKNENVFFQNLASCILSCHVTSFYLEKLKGTAYAKELLKRHLNLTLKELQKHESKEIDILYDKEDEYVTNLTDIHYDCINEFASVPIHLQGELKEVIKQFKKDNEL